MIDYRENAEKISLLKSLRRVELGWPTQGKVTHCVSFSMPLKFSSTFHSSVWTENFQMFNAHNSLSQPVHLSTTVHARYPFCSLLQSFDRSSLLRILRLLKGLRLDWCLAILFKAEVQLFRLRLRRTGWRKVARRYLAFTSYFSSHSRVMLTSFSILCFTARQRKPKEADVVSTVTNPQNFLPSLCSCPPTWASSLSRRTGNHLILYKLTSLCMFSVLFFTHFLSSNKENLWNHQELR